MFFFTHRKDTAASFDRAPLSLFQPALSLFFFCTPAPSSSPSQNNSQERSPNEPRAASTPQKIYERVGKEFKPSQKVRERERERVERALRERNDEKRATEKEGKKKHSKFFSPCSFSLHIKKQVSGDWKNKCKATLKDMINKGEIDKEVRKKRRFFFFRRDSKHNKKTLKKNKNKKFSHHQLRAPRSRPTGPRR